MNIRAPFATSALLLFGTIALPQEGAAAADPHQRDLLILADWFEGEFDNEEQIWLQNYPGMLPEWKEPHGRIHAMHRRIAMPELGEHVFYVEEYLDNDPTKVFRQRIVSLQTDPEAGGIRMRIGFLREAKTYVGGYQNPDLLNDLTLEDVFFIEQMDQASNCDVILKREGEQFEGGMIGRSCVFGEGEDRRYSIHNLVLSEDSYTRADLTRRLSDNSIKAGHPEDEPHVMGRALPFVCNGRFFNDPNATFSTGENQVQAWSGMRIHSQGGTFRVTRDFDGKEFEVLMRTKQYPFYTERPDFIYFSLREAGAERSTFFSVNDSNSRQMGVTLPGISAYCYRAGYQFDETLEQLDKAAP